MQKFSFDFSVCYKKFKKGFKKDLYHNKKVVVKVLLLRTYSGEKPVLTEHIAPMAPATPYYCCIILSQDNYSVKSYLIKRFHKPQYSIDKHLVYMYNIHRNDNRKGLQYV